MTTFEIVSEAPMNVYQIKEELDKIKKRDKELNFRAEKTKEHLDQVASNKKAIDLHGKIEKLGIQRLRDIHIHKIVDTLPQSVKDLKVVLQGFTVNISQENMKKIVDVIIKNV